MIADANGLSAGASLVAGMTLIIPGKVTNLNNTSATYQVPTQAQLLGNVQPTDVAPPPPPVAQSSSGSSGGCGGIGELLVAVVAVAVTALVLGPGAGLLNGVFGTVAGGLGLSGAALGAAEGATAGALAMRRVRALGWRPESSHSSTGANWPCRRSAAGSAAAWLDQSAFPA